MLFDQSFYMALVSVLLGLSGVAGIAARIAELCLGYSWSYRPARIISKNHER
jgi:hypothetical protein